VIDVKVKQIFNLGLFSVLFLTLIGCASIEHKTKVFEGENLITPYSGFLADWQVSDDNQEHYHSRMWQHPIHGFKDAYVVSVSLPEQRKIADIRQIIDKPGYDTCIEFSTFTLQSSLNVRYPSEIWQTNCKKKNGSEAKILHLVLQGQAGFYHIQKIWQNNFIVSDIAQWQRRFKQIYLCDTRTTAAICPNVESL